MRAAWSAWLVVVGMVGCSTEETEPEPYPSADVFCSARAENECQEATRCGTNVDQCKRQRAEMCLAAAADAKAKGRLYVPAAAKDCVEKTKGLYANGTIKPADQKPVDEACSMVFRGEAKKNGTCQVDQDCVSDLVCDKKFCSTKTVKNESEPCANPGEVCATGSYCGQVAGGPFVCLKRKEKGDPCSGAPCQETLQCTVATTVCMDRLPSGATCTPGGDECGSSAPYCDPFVKRCVEGIIFAPTATDLCKQFGG